MAAIRKRDRYPVWADESPEQANIRRQLWSLFLYGQRDARRDRWQIPDCPPVPSVCKGKWKRPPKGAVCQAPFSEAMQHVGAMGERIVRWTVCHDGRSAEACTAGLGYVRGTPGEVLGTATNQKACGVRGTWETMTDREKAWRHYRMLQREKRQARSAAWHKKKWERMRAELIREEGQQRGRYV